MRSNLTFIIVEDDFLRLIIVYSDFHKKTEFISATKYFVFFLAVTKRKL